MYNLQKSEPRVKKVQTLVRECGTNCYDKKEAMQQSYESWSGGAE